MRRRVWRRPAEDENAPQSFMCGAGFWTRSTEFQDDPADFKLRQRVLRCAPEFRDVSQNSETCRREQNWPAEIQSAPQSFPAPELQSRRRIAEWAGAQKKGGCRSTPLRRGRNRGAIGPKSHNTRKIDIGSGGGKRKINFSFQQESRVAGEAESLRSAMMEHAPGKKAGLAPSRRRRCRSA